MRDLVVLARRADYSAQPIPSPIDGQFQALMRGVADGDGFLRVWSEAPADAWGVLDVFAERMASLAVRTSDLGDLRDGLVAVQLALILTDDFRDVLPTVSLLYRAAELIGADPSHEFRVVADLAGELADEWFRGFAERGPEHRGIRPMGYAEGSDESGFRFVPLQ